MKANKKSKKVALLILNYNCQPLIKYCLKSLLSQTYKNRRIFFIDNNSTDGSRAYVKKHYPQVTLIVNQENVGIGKGFNPVIKKIINNYDYIGLFNSDIKVDKNWLLQLVKTLNQNANFKVANGLTLNWQGNIVDNAGGRLINFLSGIIGGFLGTKPIASICLKYKKHPYPVFFSIITGMLIKASAFKKVGYFDEDYFMFCEEFDFCWRVLLNGGKIICNPKAIMFHYSHYAKRNKKIIPKVLKITETNLLATYFKNLSSFGLLIIFPTLLITRFLMAIIYLFINPKITFLKIEGIYLFLEKLLSGKYYQARINNAKIRKSSDWQVLANNPASIFDIKTIFNLAPGWFKAINKDIIL
ncbi:hypothetical protein COT75_04995 [Candidatus Beckwithbacteria bacterium CG10_big_fil_rev_8_21_14_0_10_34_10]|uniref:Glycosyltransferase 2-like domain-containing protein n=1 Tax=Candidatus Beckwithbacteria bacterium CG10_big_fil_rev_8_21_14_0_10_34_10 TaxID=1974495 RepID=A0A2H0W851_9BACT|nr:MAG: hypothetical protein COT75_04995 [Candidatus Beckwithbacteria bacterium CG10_big_fil_rev_8_21_14_0_10_34_10]